jgi:hypothetical protein
MNGLGQHLARMNRLPEAEALMRRNLAMRCRAERPGYVYAMPSSSSARSSSGKDD